jgi:hypothetical protein
MSALAHACPCAICGEHTHGLNACPALREPLKEGFFRPVGGRPSGGGDDDEGVGNRERRKKLTRTRPVVVPDAGQQNDDVSDIANNEFRRVLHLL